MATTVTRTVLTPVKQTAPGATVQAGPGNWRHPLLAELEKRRRRTVFGEENVRQIAYNSLALFVIESLRAVLHPYLRVEFLTLSWKSYGSWIYAALLLVPLVNIVIALLPLFRPADDFADIPLTPSQRKLLGLPPIAKATPGATAISTPPKYSRTPSMAGTPASMKTGGSALSMAKNGSSEITLSEPYSPSPVSPLFQKVMQGNKQFTVNAFSPLGASTMSNPFGSSISSSAFGSSTGSSVFGEGPATPTPASGKRSNVSSVALTNKWLFEKRRRPDC
ncbi:nuclear pore complex component-domain-containing protein [Neurospora hispaniola]|uniref:Nuclear pore complex component-domain-containing protein n=1 Tax=Neurospora hispaniola TaxID=588809 RepID=A0AAJ0IGJ6_9PEZI|nr:nuclear pore complex component-domain-containing protein [Neurospora hispaniola]